MEEGGGGLFSHYLFPEFVDRGRHILSDLPKGTGLFRDSAMINV